MPMGVVASVSDGWLTLSGQVEWQYQRNAAYNSVRFLSGAKNFTNLITLVSKPTSDDVQGRIQSALVRSAYVDASNITVNVKGDTVTLTGNVRSYMERDVIENAAWAAPGVLNVNDNVTVLD
ncbi:BON domain-containing protein [Deinococcus psychrotolerans]|uniref:BON domain-containing protein n=1 Tax=Deinococcus psychrotolerans TaxID=2489213 RepID=A0A3G8YFT0_9DEIO|nr:BON domain-containing protein [Deinococcus psychrotolerans]